MTNQTQTLEGYVLTKSGQQVKPDTAPSDNTFRDFFYIDKYKLPYWWYVNTKGERLFIVKRLTKKDGGKYFQQGSYASGRYHKENLWTKLPDFKLPLYRLDELVKTDKETILIVEGENTCDVAQQLLPEIFVTAYSSGMSNWSKSDWSVFKALKGKNVVLWPDSDYKLGGIKNFTNLCFYLNEEYDLDAKLVNVPTHSEIVALLEGAFEKNGWDLADTIPESINVKELIETATKPQPQEDIPFSNIEDYLDNYIYISNLGNRYYDKSRREITTQEDLNNKFLRAKGRGSFTGGKAHEWFHRNNIPIVDGTTFYPTDKQIVQRGDKQLVNLYTPPKFKSLGRVAGLEDKISWFTEHLRYLCSYDEEAYQILLNMFAAALQRPYENRTWALLLYSDEGNGKGILFDTLAYCVGTRNCFFGKLSQLYNKFNSFLTRANNLFIKEANSKGSEDNQTIATLKELITETVHEVEFKGRDLLQHNCHYNIYLSSNERNPIRISRNDRRICFIACELPKKERAYYDDIYDNKVNNKDRLNEVYEYFKNVHKIPESFNLKYAPHTVWKDSLIEDSMTDYEYELTKLLEDKILESFHWDLVNVDKIYNDLSFWRVDDTRSYKNPFMDKPITKRQIRNFLSKIGAFKYRHYAIETGSEIHPRGHYWVIRNHDKWRENKDNIQAVRDHFNDKLINLRKAKDKKNHQDILSTGYKGDSEREQGNAIYDRLIQEELNKNNPLFNTKRKA